MGATFRGKNTAWAVQGAGPTGLNVPLRARARTAPTTRGPSKIPVHTGEDAVGIAEQAVDRWRMCWAIFHHRGEKPLTRCVHDRLRAVHQNVTRTDHGLAGSMERGGDR